jgi:hypothetical protein
MLDARCSMLDKGKKAIPYFIQYPDTSIQYHVVTNSNYWRFQKPWPRPGFARPELKDSSSIIKQRPQCAPGTSRQGGLDINFKIFAYEDS